jgi:hypothetical protein
MIVVIDLAKQRPGVRFEQTHMYVQSTKNRQSDAMVDDINGKPKKASRVR